MRPIARIENFLSKVDWKKLSETWNLDYNEFYGDLMESSVATDGSSFYDKWKENPDQRFGQLLINLCLIPDLFEAWNAEEDEILMSQGLPPEECLYWGRNYDKNNNLLPETEYILVKDLESDHINAIYDFFKDRSGRISKNYLIAFRNTLINRGESTEHIDEVERYWNDKNRTTKGDSKEMDSK